MTFVYSMKSMSLRLRYRYHSIFRKRQQQLFFISFHLFLILMSSQVLSSFSLLLPQQSSKTLRLLANNYYYNSRHRRFVDAVTTTATRTVALFTSASKTILASNECDGTNDKMDRPKTDTNDNNINSNAQQQRQQQTDIDNNNIISGSCATNNNHGNYDSIDLRTMDDTNSNWDSLKYRNNNYSSVVSKYIDFYHIRDRSILSTQDEARRLLHEKFDNTNNDCNKNENYYVTVIADSQTNGRGTQGRKWESETSDNTTTNNRGNNLFLTVCIPFDDIPVMITLLPLKIAVILAERIHKVIHACSITNGSSTLSESSLYPKTTVKWPNDVLINDKKVSGTLIENEIIYHNQTSTTWLIIGIGINVAYTPNLQKSPGKQIREACCIQEFCKKETANTIANLLPNNMTATILGIDIANALIDWVVSNNNVTRSDKYDMEQDIINQFRSYSQFGQTYELRGNHVDIENGGYNGELVTTIDVQYDGQLIIKDAKGNQRLLVSDYMF